MEGILGESGKADAVECIRLVTARGNVSCQWNSLQPTELFFEIWMIQLTSAIFYNNIHIRNFPVTEQL
jgi:hypothetical protein